MCDGGNCQAAQDLLAIHTDRRKLQKTEVSLSLSAPFVCSFFLTVNLFLIIAHFKPSDQTTPSFTHAKCIYVQSVH